VRLDVSSDFDEAEAALLRDTISEMCKGQAEVELTFDEPIEQTRGGKHRVVLSEL
jgi:phenylacetate-CoA ligase